MKRAQGVYFHRGCSTGRGKPDALAMSRHSATLPWLVRLLRIAIFVLLLLAAVGVGGLLLLSHRSSGIEGIVVRPDCVSPVVTTPCQIRWVPLASQVRVSLAQGQDLTTSPGPVIVTVESSADGRFQISLAPGRYFVSAYAVRDDRNWWESYPMLVTVGRSSVSQVRIEVRGFPGAQ
jgi:hypothetical protein